MPGLPPDWADPLRRALRTAYLSWEFWIPPLLAVIAIGSMVWILSHNQDLLRQHQIDSSAKSQVDVLGGQIQGLTSEVRELKAKVQVNSRDIREAKDALGPEPARP